MHVPGDVPHLRGDPFDQPGMVHFLFKDGAVDGREGCDRDKEVGSGEEPLGAIL